MPRSAFLNQENFFGGVRMCPTDEGVNLGGLKVGPIAQGVTGGGQGQYPGGGGVGTTPRPPLDRTWNTIVQKKP